MLAFYTRGKPPLTFSCPGKTPADYWGKSSGETELLFFKGELLHGCMDKAQYGKFGLVHAVQVNPTPMTIVRLCSQGSFRVQLGFGNRFVTMKSI